MTLINSIILAIIEGITEFLPISSTGHMIIASSVMGIAHEDFTKVFTVAIQLGAIMSVVVLYWRKFIDFKSFNFYIKLVVAFIPAAVFGLLLKKQIDALLENVLVVGITLFIGGFVFLFVDKWFTKQEIDDEKEIKYSTAFKIGLFQVISMMPGVSRSAATIIGGLSQKLTRKAAAEFSFFLAVPTMFAATAKSLLDYFKEGNTLSSAQINLLTIGNVVAFIVAMIAIKSFISILTKYGFKYFGYYRIIIGSVIILMYLLGYNLEII
ncbi:MAG: UDP-diphosphatase [Bacteroidetes bacterium RIFCSPLOWO2_12_FULL_31_6]|nr:MAG: UDP-diphosphatase [Bacteroidetes bacterium RIFCSPLOWO2_12_FULL_31_6]